MKIDTHQHFWRYSAPEFPWISEAMPALRRDCLPSDNAAAMRTAGVDGVVAVQARTLADETDFLLGLADQCPEVLGVVGWADLGAADLEPRLRAWCAHPAFKGLRHILQDEADASASSCRMWRRPLKAGCAHQARSRGSRSAAPRSAQPTTPSTSGHWSASPSRKSVSSASVRACTATTPSTPAVRMAAALSDGRQSRRRAGMASLIQGNSGAL